MAGRHPPLLQIGEPFDHSDWIFELKHDGFRALAHVEGHQCELVSRRSHVYKQFPMLQTEVAHAVRAMSCVLDGEIVCLAPDGRSKFYDLLFRREFRTGGVARFVGCTMSVAVSTCMASQEAQRRRICASVAAWVGFGMSGKAARLLPEERHREITAASLWPVPALRRR